MKMIKKMNVLITIFLLAFATLANAGGSISFSNSKVQSQVGESFSLDVLMSGMPMIEGGGIVLHFDPTLIEVTNVTVDNIVWRFVNNNGEINNDEGSVTDILFSSFRGVSGDAKIATVEFKSLAKKRKRGVISMTESTTNPFASAGQNISVSFEPAKIAVRRK